MFTGPAPHRNELRRDQGDHVGQSPADLRLELGGRAFRRMVKHLVEPEYPV